MIRMALILILFVFVSLWAAAPPPGNCVFVPGSVEYLFGCAR